MFLVRVACSYFVPATYSTSAQHQQVQLRPFRVHQPIAHGTSAGRWPQSSTITFNRCFWTSETCSDGENHFVSFTSLDHQQPKSQKTKPRRTPAAKSRFSKRLAWWIPFLFASSHWHNQTCIMDNIRLARDDSWMLLGRYLHGHYQT
jgi:hypothetical protein